MAEGRPLLRLVDTALLALVGLVALADGGRLIATKRETVGGPEAGGWVAGLGALLLVGATAHCWSARRGATGSEDAPGRMGGPAAALALTLGYVALLQPLGYLLTTALFMAAYLRIFGRYGWLRVILIAVPFALLSAWLWNFMNLMLPQGVLPWP